MLILKPSEHPKKFLINQKKKKARQTMGERKKKLGEDEARVICVNPQAIDPAATNVDPEKASLEL